MKAYPAYKDSGVVWFGPIPQHWDTGQLKFRLSNNDGGVWGDDFADDGTIVLRSTEITLDGSWNLEAPAIRTLNKYEIEKTRLLIGDLLITKSSGSEKHIGKTALVTQEVEKLDACYSNFMQRVRPRNNLESRFLHFFLNSSLAREQYNYHSTTTTGLANLNAVIIGNLRVPIAPLPEQQAIVDFLDRKTAQIDALIDKKQRQIELLQEHRTALINQAVTKGLNPDVPIKDSDIEWLGEIPRHWEVVCLKYLLQNGLSNGIFKKKDQFGQGTKLVNVSDLYQDNYLVDFDSLERVQTNLDETEKFLVSPGDIFFVRSSLKLEGVGVSVCITDAPEPTVFECHVVKVSPNKGLVNPIFLIYYLNSFLARHRLVALAETVTMTTLRQSQISSLEIAVPPLDEQSVIVEHLVKLNNKIQYSIRNICSEIKALGEYRTALISAAVTGKIDVRSERD